MISPRSVEGLALVPNLLSVFTWSCHVKNTTPGTHDWIPEMASFCVALIIIIAFICQAILESMTALGAYHCPPSAVLT